MKHEYTIDDFSFDNFYKTIEEEGYWSVSCNAYAINYSSILTDLIQNVGRFCEHYASDLFIDWKIIDKNLSTKHENGEKYKYLFGLRENGVDHNAFIISRYNNKDYKEYRKLLILEIEYSDDDKVIMKYGKCNVKYYSNF